MHRQSLKESIASKKLWFAVAAILFSLGFAFLAAVKFIEMKSMYESFNGLIEFVVAAYLSGNVANKFIVGKHAIAQAAAEKVVGEPPEPPKQP